MDYRSVVIQEPQQPIKSPPPAPRHRPGDRTLLGLAIVACLALAIPVLVVMRPSPSTDPTVAVGASASPGAEKQESSADPDHGSQPNKALKPDKADKHLGKSFGAIGRGPITIRAISGNQISLATDDGWSRTITATSSTVITKGGKTISVGDLAVGDTVRFSQTRNADGTYTIETIVVPTPIAGGEVTAVDATSITVKGKGGTTQVITVNGSTAYKLGSAAGTAADVKVGSRVLAQGTMTGDTFTAITVTIMPSEVGGVVTAKTADSITVKHGDGSTTVIHVTDKTTYEKRGKDSATLSDIAVGDVVGAEGMLRADGSLDAVSVEGRAPKPPKPAKSPATSAAPG